jgi:cell filamentation protein
MDADYQNYDLQDEDPYLIPGSSCLVNSLGITDTARLNQAEADISAVAYAQLIAFPITPSFDLAHLCAIHAALFGNVYPWAGELRRTEIGKGGKLFLPYSMVETIAHEIFRDLHGEGLLRTLEAKAFAERAAYYLGRINLVHAFREGNGRTQRILIDQLAELSGYAFEWWAISGEQMAQAFRAARQDVPDYSLLVRLLQLHITTL